MEEAEDGVLAKTSENWPSSVQMRFNRSPFSAASLFRDDINFAERLIKLDEEAV